MGVYRPVRTSGGHLREMSTAELLLVHKEGINQYGHNPTVVLTVTQNTGNLAAITDTRYQAGAAVSALRESDAVPYPTPTENTSAISVINQHITRTHINLSPPTRAGTAWEDYSFPVWMDTNNPGSPYGPGPHMRAMNANDFMDTFCSPCLDYLITNEGTDDNELRAGTYHISTSQNVTGSTLVSTTPVFTDTKADITAFGSGDLPELQDQPVASPTSYFLHRFDPTPISYVTPVVYKISTGELMSMPKPAFSDMFGTWLRYTAATNGSTSGLKKIDYQLYNNDSSLTSTMDNRGTAMLNTSTSAQTTRQFEQTTYGYGYSLYIAQNVPSGSQTANSANTWHLRIFHINTSGTPQ